jgi:hypothetical protein
MNDTVEEHARQSRAFHERLNDRELDDYLARLTRTLEEADTMYHRFGQLLKHIRATVVHSVRSKHLQGAIEAAERHLKRAELAKS